MFPDLFKEIWPSASVGTGLSMPSDICRMPTNAVPSFDLHMVYRIQQIAAARNAFLIPGTELSNSFTCIAFTLKRTVCIVTRRSPFSEAGAINLTRHCHRSDDRIVNPMTNEQRGV
jgi:hypothetical protein